MRLMGATGGGKNWIFWLSVKLQSDSQLMGGAVLPPISCLAWGEPVLESTGSCCCSTTKRCPTLCHPMDYSTPDSPFFTVSQSLVKFMSEWCHPNSSSSVGPFSSCPQSFPASGYFPMSWLLTSNGQSIGASASASVLPMNSQDWCPLELTVLISLLSRGLSRVMSSTQFKSINSSTLSLLYGLILTCVHDYWKNHSLDYMDLCWQSDVFAF